MAEKVRADIYIANLDQILAGKENIEPVEDEEIEKLLQLSKTMLAEDLSLNSKMQEKLRKQLLAQFINKSNLSTLLSKDDELDEETLEQVTAAGQASEQKEVCPYCGSRSINIGGKCSFCR